MAFRYRRSGGRYRRNYRRRTLSSYSIATRTGARAQAKQIYSLNRRITSIQRRTKPEIKVLYSALSTAPSNGNFAGNPSVAFSPTLDGNFCRLQNATVFFRASYQAVSDTSQPVTIRVLVLQTLASRATQVENNDIWGEAAFSGANSNTVGNYIEGVFGPLRTGLARTLRVVADRRLYLSDQRPQIFARINCKRLLNYYKAANDNVAKGSIIVAIMGYCPGTNDGTAAVNVSFRTKVAYTDA